jgi:hypothetical protein
MVMADRVISTEPAHKRPDDLDPKVNGPFLDDIREEQARARFEARNKNAVKKSAVKKKESDNG